MDGNKPLATFTSAFTARIAAHPRVAYWPHPKCGALVMMVIDQILVGRRELGERFLKGVAEPTGGVVFPGKDESEGNVEIWRLLETPGDKGVPDVAHAVWQARGHMGEEDASLIAPNHVLLPAPNFHSCPWGPPEETGYTGADLGAPTDAVRVTVIDSGYVPNETITDRLEDATYGWWFGLDPSGAYTWVQENPATLGVDPLDQDGDYFLDALAGHANFVAGVVAQACPGAAIRVVSHNGAFVNHDDNDPVNTPLPTEASVARSLWETLTNDPWSDVINVGFAFPTLPPAPPVGAPLAGPPSWAFTAVLDEFKKRSKDFFVVAPAGNQHCFVPQYPAAFFHTHPNVIGVASIDATGDLSQFSNYGRWVACSAEGEDVFSAFVDWSGLTEEFEVSGPYAGWWFPKDFSGWGTWSGTSFAAPKVAGALADAVLKGSTLQQGWNNLVNSPTTVASASCGYKLPNLPPD